MTIDRLKFQVIFHNSHIYSFYCSILLATLTFWSRNLCGVGWPSISRSNMMKKFGVRMAWVVDVFKTLLSTTDSQDAIIQETKAANQLEYYMWHEISCRAKSSRDSFQWNKDYSQVYIQLAPSFQNDRQSKIFSEKSLSSRPISSHLVPPKVTETENFAKQCSQRYFKGEKIYS